MANINNYGAHEAREGGGRERDQHKEGVCATGGRKAGCNGQSIFSAAYGVGEKRELHKYIHCFFKVRSSAGSNYMFYSSESIVETCNTLFLKTKLLGSSKR